MVEPNSTRWSLIRGAAEGGEAERAEFARTYEPVVRAYLSSRWRHGPLRAQVDDATQEVFLICFKQQSPLERADPSRPSGFRGFLFGVAKNVARRFEEKRVRAERESPSNGELDAVEADMDTPSRVFDRAWAKAILRDAVRLQEERAGDDETAIRRKELLRLRFQDGLPIREIAKRWGEDPARLHRQYARARREFAAALREVVGRNLVGDARRIDAECARLAEFLR